MTFTDYELGYLHGKTGSCAKYPNNINYKKGHSAGEKALLRELMASKPDESYTPCGTNDAHIDQFYA